VRTSDRTRRGGPQAPVAAASAPRQKASQSKSRRRSRGKRLAPPNRWQYAPPGGSGVSLPLKRKFLGYPRPEMEGPEVAFGIPITEAECLTAWSCAGAALEDIGRWPVVASAYPKGRRSSLSRRQEPVQPAIPFRDHAE
jgi:hypothetical protein